MRAVWYDRQGAATRSWFVASCRHLTPVRARCGSDWKPRALIPRIPTDRGFESTSLQRRVFCEPDFLDHRLVARHPARPANRRAVHPDRADRSDLHANGGAYLAQGGLAKLREIKS
jgi:hypothetical protein